jgi:hypothetical protein
MNLPLVAKALEQTNEHSPSQWIGELEDGGRFQIQYRFGLLRLTLFGDTPVIVAEFPVGPEERPIMGFEEMQFNLWQYIRFPWAEAEL